MKANLGKAFEARFQQNVLMMGHAVVRIPDGVRQLSAGRGVRVKSDFDWACAVDARAVFLDTKHCGENAFNLKSKVYDAKKVHQIRALLEAERRGAIAGFLIWFSEHQLISWIRASQLNEAFYMGVASLKPTDHELGMRTQRDNVKIDLRKLSFASKGEMFD